MPINIQDNLLKLKERHVRTELWKDKIYHMPFNPYKFPKNDGSGEFMPLPKRFSEIITEFRKHMDEQKAQEKSEEEKQEAKDRIKEIYAEIKEIIIQEIEHVQNLSPSDFGDESEELVGKLKDKLSAIETSIKSILEELREKNKEINLLKRQLPITQTYNDSWSKWKDISIHFTEEAAVKWLSYGFDYNHTANWINTGLKPSDSEYAYWLRNVVEFDSEQYLNETGEGDEEALREQFEEYKKNRPSFEIIREEIKQLEVLIAELKIKKEELSKEKTNLSKELKEAEKASKDYEVSSEKAKTERIKQLELGLKQNTASKLRRFNQEVLNNDEEINELLDEWKEQRKITLDNKNACFIDKDDWDGMIIFYQPPKGDFHALDNFLWYRNNIWYETVSWQRINHENAVIVIKRSFFIHNYHDFFLKGANGIFHNHPLTKNTEEICMCPDFLEGTEIVDFISDWQPSYQLFKIKKELLRITSISSLVNAKGQYPVFSSIALESFNPLSNISLDLTDSEYLLLPKWYAHKGNNLFQQRKETARFVSSASKISLKDWLDDYQANHGQNNEHLLKKIHVNFIWNSKVIYPSKLSDFEFDAKGNPILEIEIRANPAEIIYIFRSKKVLFRLSEDVGFTSQAETLTKIAMGVVQGYTGIKFDEAVRNSLHDVKKKKEKPQDERKWERTSQLVTDSNIAKMTLGTIPALIDASHTRNDYTLSEFALRFDANNLIIRLEYNKNQFERYQKTKVLKRPCNSVFNVKKIGDTFHKGFIKAVPNIFEGDKNGYFAGLLSKGVYFYEKHPEEYFEEKLKEFSFKNEIANNETVSVNTTIYNSYSSAVGRDDQVHVDNMSWVWKASYLKPKKGGTDLFPQLINGMRQNIKQEDSNAWKFNGYSDGDSKLILQKDLEYNWYMKAFSSGQEDKKGIRALNDGTEANLIQRQADWELKIGGPVAITETVGNPNAIGGGTEFEEVVEDLPDMEDEKQTSGLESMEQAMQAEAEQQNQFDKELLEELEGKKELNDEQTKQKEDELELEPEPSKWKEDNRTKEKTKEEQQEDEGGAERSGNEK